MAFRMERITEQSLVFLKNPSAPTSTCQRTSRRLCSNLLVLVTVLIHQAGLNKTDSHQPEGGQQIMALQKK